MKTKNRFIAFAAIVFILFCLQCSEDDDSEDSDNDTDDDDTDDDDDDTVGDDDTFDVVTDVYGIRWIRVPEGDYTMGCSSGDEDCTDRDHAPKEVHVKAFLMMQYEMTNQNYFDVMGEHPEPDILQEKPDYPLRVPMSDPVSEICENAALAEEDGRLPTPEEWEYAARAGTTTRYYCGDDPSCLDEISWWSGNSPAGEHMHDAQQVGLKNPNAWGFYDILGNAWEVIDDTNICDPDIGYGSDVARGGSAMNETTEMRVSYPNFISCGPGGQIGVRCVKDEVD